MIGNVVFDLVNVLVWVFLVFIFKYLVDRLWKGGQRVIYVVVDLFFGVLNSQFYGVVLV